MDTEKRNLLTLALSLAPKVEIDSVRLLASTIKSSLGDNPFSLQVEYTFGAKTLAIPETSKILVNTRLAVCAKSNGDTPDNMRLRITADFSLDYTVKSLDGISDDVLNAFGKVNGIHNVWPYWREYVQSTVGRLGLPPLVLPILTGSKIAKIYEQITLNAETANSNEDSQCV
jgi:hypothetical protein